MRKDVADTTIAARTPISVVEEEEEEEEERGKRALEDSTVDTCTGPKNHKTRTYPFWEKSVLLPSRVQVPFWVAEHIRPLRLFRF